MLLMYHRLIGKPVVSLRSLHPIGRTVSLVINPTNLHIDALIVDTGERKPYYLVAADIRDYSAKAIVINDQEDLVLAEDLVRLKPIIDIAYDPIGKPVVNGSGTLGKVTSFAIDKQGMYVQKLYVKPGFLRNFFVSELTIDRLDILDVTPKKIVVVDSTVTDKESATEPGGILAAYSSPSSATTSATSE
jgi:uncharacterized protein YrrD